MAKRKIKDLEFAVDDASGNERIFDTFDEAAGFAVAIAAGGPHSLGCAGVLAPRRGGVRWR